MSYTDQNRERQDRCSFDMVLMYSHGFQGCLIVILGDVFVINGPILWVHYAGKAQTHVLQG